MSQAQPQPAADPIERTLDPAAIADPHRRLHCPACGGTVVREPLAGDAHGERLEAECAYCPWRQVVIVAADGSAQTDQDHLELAAQRAKGQGAADRVPTASARRSKCLVPDCRKLTVEGGLCGQHRLAWKHSQQVAGRAMSAQQWLLERDQREQQAAEAADDVPAVEQIEQPPAPEHVQADEPTPESITEERVMCQVKGCNRDVLSRGLCSSHYSRWLAAEKPDIDQFIRDQADAPPLRQHGNAGKASSSKPRRQEPAEPTPPAAEAMRPDRRPGKTAAGTAALPGFREIALPEGQHRLLIGLLGEHVTVATAAGLVIDQFQLEW